MRVVRGVGVRSLLALWVAVSCASCGTDTSEDPVLGRWRIVQISQEGRLVYQVETAPMLIDLQLMGDGEAMRITTQVATGASDSVAMSYTRTDGQMTVSAPNEEPVTYAYALADDGSTATFTTQERVLHLQRVGATP